MSQPRLVDLHTHTTASDGTDSPSTVVAKAAQAGLLAVAITDHDTVAGLDEAEEAGARHHIEVIRGCELSSTYHQHSVHILGLWLPQNHSAYTHEFINFQQQRHTRNKRILDKLQALGIPLSYDTIIQTSIEHYHSDKAIGRPHIAAALIQGGYVANHLEAFDRYLGKGKPAYVQREDMTSTAAVALLASLGATVSIAHPMLISCDVNELNDIIADLKAAGLHAIEAYHSSHSEYHVRQCVDLARRHALTLTGGSDYHGTAKPKIQLGKGRGSLRVAWHVLEALKAQRRALALPV